MFSLLAFDILKGYVGVPIRAIDGTVLHLEYVQMLPDSDLVRYKYKESSLSQVHAVVSVLRTVAEAYGRTHNVV